MLIFAYYPTLIFAPLLLVIFVFATLVWGGYIIVLTAAYILLAGWIGVVAFSAERERSQRRSGRVIKRSRSTRLPAHNSAYPLTALDRQS